MTPHRVTPGNIMSMSKNGTFSPLSSCENTSLNESAKDITCGSGIQSENGSAHNIQKQYLLPHHLEKYDHENTLAADFSAVFNEDNSATLENGNISVRNLTKAVKPLPHQLDKYQHENTLAADLSGAFQSGNCSSFSDVSTQSQKKKTLPHQFDRYKHDNTLAADFSSAFACKTSTSSVDGPSIKKQKVLPHMQQKYQHDNTLMADFSAAFPRTNHTASLLSINHSSSIINSSIQRSRRNSERLSLLKSNVTGSEFSLEVVIEQSPNTTCSDGNSTLAAEPDLDALIIEEQENVSIAPPKDSLVNVLIPDPAIINPRLSVRNISTQTLQNEDSLSLTENAHVSVVLPNESSELRSSTAIFDVPAEKSVADVHLLSLNTTHAVRTSITQISNIDCMASPLSLHSDNTITENNASILVPPAEDKTSISNRAADDEEASLQPQEQSGCELDLLGVNVTPSPGQPGNVDDYRQSIQSVESTLLSDQEMDTTLVPAAICSVDEEYTQTLNSTPAATVSSVNISSSSTQFSLDIAENMFQDDEDEDEDDDEDDVFKMPEIPAVKRNARKRSGKLLDFENGYEEQLPKRPTFPKYANYMGPEFYKLLIEKMTPKYGVKTNEKVVKVAKYISDTVCEVTWKPDREKYLPKIKELKLTLARKQVVQTHLDFYIFCIRRLPDYFYKKAVPMIVPTGTVPRHDPADEKTIFQDIRLEEDYTL